MNSRPRIDSPCPLRFGAMPQEGMDFCTRCSRQVHNLDEMDATQRAAFLATCNAPICVAYRVRRSPLLAATAGLALLGGCSHTPELAVAPQDSESQSDYYFLVGGVNDPGQAVLVDVDVPALPQGAEGQWLDENAPMEEFVAAPVEVHRSAGS